MTQWVYGFGAGKSDGRADMRNLLGGKGQTLPKWHLSGCQFLRGSPSRQKSVLISMRMAESIRKT